MENNNVNQKSKIIQYKISTPDKKDKRGNSLPNQNKPISPRQNDINEDKLESSKKKIQIIGGKGSQNMIINMNNINENSSLLDKNKKEYSNSVKNIKKEENIKIVKLDENKIGKKGNSNLKEKKYFSSDKEYNNNVYTLLNSYYKDVDLNFKNNNNNNNHISKNFLLKNNFQEQSNNSITLNNVQYPYQYNPYIDNNNTILNNQNLFSYYINNNNQIQRTSYNFPENAFSFNNQTNYYFTNNYNNFNYNFHNNNNKIKYNKKSKENNEYKFYKINLDNILKGIDTRTTIMIRHIPNKYSYHNLLEEIDTVCKDKYDFFYLPLDSENNCNLGYAFINFIDPLHIIYFYNIFKSRKWLHFNSYKECDLTFAKYQGKYELTSNIEKKMGKNEDKRRLPLIFEVKTPAKIVLLKKYYNSIKEYKPELLNVINWI